MVVDRDVSTAYCWSSSGDDVDWLCLIISSTVAVCDWCISILAVAVNDWRIAILIVLTRSCSLCFNPTGVPLCVSVNKFNLVPKRIMSELIRMFCDLSVVSDLKTVRTPCCCKQRRRASDTPLLYGRTAVNFGSVAGSVLAVGPLAFVMFFTNEYGYPLETRTDDKFFFSLEITDGLGYNHWECQGRGGGVSGGRFLSLRVYFVRRSRG